MHARPWGRLMIAVAVGSAAVSLAVLGRPRLFHVAPSAAELDPDVFAKWRKSGLVPSETEIARIRKALPSSLLTLRKGLLGDDSFIRKCSAYVVRQLGGEARSLGPELRLAFDRENDEVTRCYFLRALARIGDDSAQTVWFLEAIGRDGERGKTQLVPTEAAGALLILRGREACPDAWDTVIDSAGPSWASGDREDGDVDLFWERRLAASRILGDLGHGGQPALPVLTRLIEDARTPQWVRKRVVIDVKRIQGKAGDSIPNGESR